MARKHTLLMDGNHFLFKTLYVIPKSGGKLLDNKSDKEAFIKKLCIDFAAEIRKFSLLINRVVFTIDSSSWRKEFYPKEDYKGNRVLSDAVNWTAFYEMSEEFKTILRSKGVIIHKVNGAEGDDLVYAWSKYLNLKGENVIIVSGDKDFMQLVDYNESTKSYTILYTNTNKRITVYPGFNDWLHSMEDSTVTSIFDMKKTVYGDDATKKVFSSLIQENGLETIVVDTDFFVFTKVLCGDRGDNVPSAYHYEKNGKTYSISELKAKKVYDAFIEKHKKFDTLYLFEKSYREDIADMVVEKLNAHLMSHSQILSNIEKNVMMMLLHHNSIPDEIQQQMFKTVEELYLAYRTDISQLHNMKDILKDTKYALKVFTPKGFDFFGNDNDD